MRFSTKTKYSFLAFLFAIGLMGCGDSSIAPVIDGPSSPKYLLDGTLSNVTDANGFAYYTNGNEAYVARGTNTSTTPEIPDEVTLGGKTYSVTGVYHSGFAKADITSITLPLSIETIDYQAFANSQLTSVTIPCNVEAMGSGAFMNCHSLAAVQFKNDESAGSSTIGVCGGGGGGGGGGGALGESHLTTIPDYCFFNCESLTTVSFPRALTTVNSCAFSNCVGLTKLAFLSGFTTLKTLALESCTALKEVYFPSTFTEKTGYPANCEQGAFYNVNKDCKIYLSTTNETIYNAWDSADPWRYYGNGSNPLKHVARQTTDIGLGSDYLYRVENGKATIFSYAPASFPVSGVVVMPNKIDNYDVARAEATTYASYKTQITQVYLSNNLESIENSFFDGMTNLTAVSSTGNGCYTPQDNVIDLGSMTKLTSVGTNLFTNATYMTGTFNGTLTLPISLTTIGSGAFKGLSKATKIQFATGTSELTTVGSSAFLGFGQSRAGDGFGDGFGNATFDLTLPATCTSIGESAFSAVYGLKKITFSGAADKTLNIGKTAFAYCRTLCEINFPTENTAVKIGEKAFYCCSAGAQKSFMNISGLEAVYLPPNVTQIGSMAFACNERACFFFGSANNPASFNDNFNQVFVENGSSAEYGILAPNNKSFQYHGIRENNGMYMNVGFNDGSTSLKKRYIQTGDFCFVETAYNTGEFICARYLYKPENMANNAHVTVTVPEYIKFTDSTSDAPYAGEVSTTNTDFKVVSIGDSCFSASYSRGGKALAAVNVPNQIKKIGDNAFMRSIFFNALNSYTGNASPTANNFPSSLRYIGRSAFAFCRLTKALNIPKDIMTFDMIAPAALKAGTIPTIITNLDGTTPRTYTSDEPRGYSSIFANDWVLNEVTFGDPVVENAAQTMVYDGDIYGLYTLKEIAADGTMSPHVQLSMILPKLKNTFTVYSTANEKDHVDKTTIDLGGTDHELRADTDSIRYGAWRMASWATGITLDSNVVGLFPKKWNSDTPIPQALLIACVNLPNYMNIGAGPNDVTYNIETTSFAIKGSPNGFIMPIGVLRNASKVTSMTIPGNITEIPAFAFDQDVNIAQWYTPAVTDGSPVKGGADGGDGVLDLRHTSLTAIGTSAFWGLNKTTKIYLPSTLTVLGKDGNNGEIRSCFEREVNKLNISSALTEVNMADATLLTTVPLRCFGSHGNLATVTLPPNIASVGENCFYGCPINSLTWPSGGLLTTISKQAFYASRIVDLQIPNTVTTLGDSAFQSNTAMTKLRLPTALTSDLGGSQFKDCSALNQVYFTDVRTARSDKSLTLSGSCFPANVKYAMLPQFINDGTNRPFNACTNLKAIFYGLKASQASASTTITSYSSSSKTAPIYYYAEDANDFKAGITTYWRQKPGYPHIAQVITNVGGTYTVTATEYDFTTVLA